MIIELVSYKLDYLKKNIIYKRHIISKDYRRQFKSVKTRGYKVWQNRSTKCVRLMDYKVWQHLLGVGLQSVEKLITKCVRAYKVIVTSRFSFSHKIMCFSDEVGNIIFTFLRLNSQARH